MNESDLHAAVSHYIEELKGIYYSGYATEVSYRGIIELLIEKLLPEVDAINEPKRVSVGAPDFVLTKRQADPRQTELIRSVPLGFIEAKDLKPDILDRPENKSQVDRYMDLGNVVHTDGLIFRFYFDREMVKEVTLGTINEQGNLVTNSEQYDDLEFYLRRTVETTGRTINTAKALALHMADRARPIRRAILEALEQDIKSGERSELVAQYEAFKETLIHDLSTQDFADIYAETIAYGLFAARYNDDTPDNFNLSEAAQKVPQTNPFLRQFFLQIAAYEKDIRLDWVLNNFADLFSYSDVHKIMSTYGKTTGMNHDPVTHFYETFLGEYDPKRRKARGVYYTPLPVVQYIVRAVDKVLKEEFGLADGLADDSTITQTFNVAPYKVGKAKDAKVYHTETKEIPRVQILDPATGTSTFLNETVKLIAERKKGIGSGWNDYVEKNLLPRIHGFEILMAAYSMAHMRLGLTLAETGYKPSANAPRLGVYLTNSLEQPAEDEPPLLAMMGMGRILTEEAMAADHVKRDLPIMVVMGNPPYSVSSANKSKYIDTLMADYKKDLNERNIQPLSDDYIKFIRYAESMIEKSGQGVVAMITNNSFIDGLIHRQMRKHLLETFDKIWVLDLHGNAKKKEVAPDGGKDENVFDIMQGVSIVVMVKSGNMQVGKLAEAHFSELYGKRSEKYAALESEITYSPLMITNPSYYLVKKDLTSQVAYEQGVRINLLFGLGNVGLTSARDSLLIGHTQKDVEIVKSRLSDPSVSDLLQIYPQAIDSRDWSLEGAKSDIHNGTITKVAYRPLDSRFIIYSKNSKGILSYPRYDVMKHFIDQNNLGLVVTKLNRQVSTSYFFITDTLIERHVLDSAADSTFVFPLYTYDTGKRLVNFESSQLKSLLSNLEPYRYVDDRTDVGEANNDMLLVDARDVLNYIYGVLHSPSYRTKYKEFLKIDFPRVPKPTSHQEFVRYSLFGGQLVGLHLMKDVTPGDYPFSGEGEGNVEKISFTADTSGGGEDASNTTGSVYINQAQYFANVPETAWNFYIGGYQPAQKWLKDRKGRPLGYKDIEHYQRIIYILLETDRLMKALR